MSDAELLFQTRDALAAIALAATAVERAERAASETGDVMDVFEALLQLRVELESIQRRALNITRWINQAKAGSRRSAT